MIYVKVMITKRFCIFVQNYKMLRLLFVIISSIFIISCSKSSSNNVLAEKEMSALLLEVHLTDGYLSSLSKDSAEKVLPVLYDQIFKKFSIDSTSFATNIAYYMGDPTLVEKVYGDVHKKLQEMNRQYATDDSLKMVHVQDSVNRVMRLQKNASDMNNLILQVAKDTSKMNYSEFARQFYTYIQTPLQVYGIHTSLMPSAALIVPTPTSSDSSKPINIDSIPARALTDTTTNRPKVDTGLHVPSRMKPRLVKPVLRPNAL